MDNSAADALQTLLERVHFPPWAQLELAHDGQRLADVRAALAEQLQQPGTGDTIRPGMRVALTAGSRGIDSMAEVLAALVAEVKLRGGEPFVVPAMGSHGGAVASGQLEVLAQYGITEATLGCPIRASMDVVELGRLPSGERIYTDRIAYNEADLIVPVNRVKPHTDFRGTVESGLCKMLAIGLGKQQGADSLHAGGFERFAELIPTAARFLLERLPVPFGVALIENGYAKLARLEVLPAAELEQRESRLLDEARARMARLPVDHLHVLVIERMGKDISGAGMDPNVLGRAYGSRLPGGPHVQIVVVLDLTEITEGNATGVGLADVCTERLASKIDRVKTYINQLTAKTLDGGRLPLVAPNDRAALQMAVAGLSRAPDEPLRLLRIRDTKDLGRVWASAALLPEIMAAGRAKLLGEPSPVAFDNNGNL